MSYHYQITLSQNISNVTGTILLIIILIYGPSAHKFKKSQCFPLCVVLTFLGFCENGVRLEKFN